MEKVGTAPVPIAVLDGGKKAIAGNSNRLAGGSAAETLSLLDAVGIGGAAAAVIGSVPTGAFPRDLRVSANGSLLYLANFSSIHCR